MKEFERAKQEYENIAIPKELSERITLEIKKAEEKRSMKNKKSNIVKFTRWAATAVAAAACVFVVGLNTSQTFAQEMGKVPVIGTLAKVLTFREYEAATEDYIIKVEIPSIEMISGDFKELEENVNEEIYTFCEAYANEAIKRAEEYREAFISTGGTLEEWLAHDIKINVSYEVKKQDEQYLVLAVKGTESWTSAYAETKMFCIDLLTGEQVDFDTAMEETYYEDAFAVETEIAKAFAQKIQAAVAAKDIEKLADLTGFPVYVGYVDEGIVVETREDFVKLGAEKLFTEALVNAIANADFSDFGPSMAGFFVSDSDMTASITFDIVDGQLKITGIN